MAKIIIERLNKVVDKIISPNQRGSVKGLRIAKNIGIAQKVIQVRKHKGKDGLMVLKIDMKKTYDWMKFPFIIHAL